MAFGKDGTDTLHSAAHSQLRSCKSSGDGNWPCPTDGLYPLSIKPFILPCYLLFWPEASWFNKTHCLLEHTIWCKTVDASLTTRDRKKKKKTPPKKPRKNNQKPQSLSTMVWEFDTFRSTDPREKYRPTQLLLGLAWEPWNNETKGEQYWNCIKWSVEWVLDKNNFLVITNLTYFHGTLNNFFLDSPYGFSALQRWISNSYWRAFLLLS